MAVKTRPEKRLSTHSSLLLDGSETVAKGLGDVARLADQVAQTSLLARVQQVPVTAAAFDDVGFTLCAEL